MSQLQYIHLNKLRFFAAHGLYKGEAELGNEFEVQVDVAFTAAPVFELSDTINYMSVYGVVKQQMATTRSLLETVAQATCQGIKLLDERIQQVTVTITKLHVPVAQFTGTVGVTCTL